MFNPNVAHHSSCRLGPVNPGLSCFCAQYVPNSHTRADVEGVRDHRGMNPQHPFHDRPDHLPISAEVWDAARRYSGIGLTTAIYQALKKLETDVIALRKAR
jgi:hypothetical protein